MNDKLNDYIDYLLNYTQKINVISRNVSRSQVLLLIDESHQVARLVSQRRVVDVGSGNGLLGIPLALHFPEKEVVLVESALKKVDFLRAALARLELINAEVFHGSIQEFMHHFDDRRSSLVARGFPATTCWRNMLRRVRLRNW